MSYSSRSNQLNAYRETRVRTAGQGQIIVMLYDETVKQLDIAISLLEQGTRELDKVHNAIVRAQDCITELTVGLDLDKGGQLATSLYNLYRFFHRELTDANIAKDPERLRSVRNLVNELRSAWAQITNRQPAESESGTSQSGGPRNTDSGGNVNFAG